MREIGAVFQLAEECPAMPPAFSILRCCRKRQQDKKGEGSKSVHQCRHPFVFRCKKQFL
jgi:hypothetical protein